MRSISRMLLALVAATLPGVEQACAEAPTDSPPESSLRMDRLVIVANRIPEPLLQVVTGVALIEREEIERRLVQDSDDLVRYIPGVTMDADANRFGRQGFSIRGLGGNRVRVEIDGVAMPDAFSVGQFAAAGRDLVDLEVIERVEILRGPASTLYGSDALAGIVLYATRSPESMLGPGADSDHVGVRAGWSGRDNSHLLSASWAAVADSGWQGLAVISRRDGHQDDNRAWREQDAANPADYRRDTLLAKLVRDAGDLGRWQLIADHSRQRRVTDVVSQRFAGGRFATTYRLDADDHSDRDRLSLGSTWTQPRPWLEHLEFLAYGQQSAIRQDTDQYRLADSATPFESLRSRRFEFKQSELGLDVVAQSRLQTGSAAHWWVYGIEIERTGYRGLRDGVETNLQSGSSSNVILGESLPVRDFPHSNARRSALFVQDQITIGRLSITPALRWEHFRLDARPDALFVANYPDTDSVDVTETSLTPRLGLRWALADNSQLFLQYARGFRAPPFSDVNIGLSLPVFNYEVRSNPDLRPERSRGLEAGWRWQNQAMNLTVSAFRNDYRDLIDSRANLGVDPESGALVFQSVNRRRARISGVELEAGLDLGALWQPAEGWSAQLAAARSRGDDLFADQPLNSIEPMTVVAGLRFDAPSTRWGGELVATGVERKRRVAQGNTALFVPPGYAVLDAYLWFRPSDRLGVNLAVYNLADRRYWSYANVRGLPANTSNLGFYTRPGRSVSVSVNMDW